MSTRIWSDRWVPGIQENQPIPRDPWVSGIQDNRPIPRDSSVDLSSSVYVSSLICQNSRPWDREMICVLFDENSTRAILKLSLPHKGRTSIIFFVPISGP